MLLAKTISRYISLAVLVLAITVGASAQIMPSSCVPTGQMESIFRNDVVKTITSRLFQINSTYKDSADIPAAFKDTIARAFYAVHNMPYSSLRDTIRNLFAFQDYNMNLGLTSYERDSLHIHNNLDMLTGFSIKAITMSVPDSTTWAQQWAAGNVSNTVNPSVNALVLQNGISITGSNTNNSYIFFNIRTIRAVNTFGLSKAFNVIIGPQSSTYAAKPQQYAFDKNSIQLQYQPDGLVVLYYNWCGDCLLGCTYGRRWSFKVYYSNCGVQYLGATNIGDGTNPFDPNTSVFTCTRGPVLPLTFTGLTGYLQAGHAALSWQVLTQLNVKEYVVERSDDGRQFYTAGTVAANTLPTATYAWKETAALIGTAWYRIRAVDKDGKEKYSSIVKIGGGSSNRFTVYPNPVQQHTFTLQFATPLSGRLQAGLYNTNGEKVWSATLSLLPQTASRSFTLPATVLPGVYAIIVKSDGGGSYHQTLMVQ